MHSFEASLKTISGYKGVFDSFTAYTKKNKSERDSCLFGDVCSDQISLNFSHFFTYRS